jgi:cytidine deaminase|uniref:Cytidine deaminase n=1 Tax=Desulfobacca acetoxidans TaxID=60893 RepID=A0A7C5EL67_9BACT
MGTFILGPREQARLWQEAREGLSRAYAPYSGIKVGAAVLTGQGNFYNAGNLENASYGLTLCAERAAIARALAEEGPGLKVLALAVLSDRPGAFAPCGACRQVIFEFGPEALVLFHGPDGPLKVSINALLPQAFQLRE